VVIQFEQKFHFVIPNQRDLPARNLFGQAKADSTFSLQRTRRLLFRSYLKVFLPRINFQDSCETRFDCACCANSSLAQKRQRTKLRTGGKFELVSALA